MDRHQGHPGPQGGERRLAERQSHRGVRLRQLQVRRGQGRTGHGHPMAGVRDHGQLLQADVRAAGSRLLGRFGEHSVPVDEGGLRI